MADYNLTGLSTRSFEQLIQAIAAKVIGPNVVIFGDGRDGGREATFEGSITYSPKAENWVGYGVVQAKFKQRPQDTQADGEWALNQLRSELMDFANPKKARRKPDYYIFATNVILTPYLEKGSKDRMKSLIEEFNDRVPLKDYDIWDYDKIRVFLDDNEDIRRGYAAWITPGDVLSKVLESLEHSSPDFEQTLTRYLQEELLADQYANLEQAGHASDARIPIARVFIDLPTFDRYLVDPPEEDDSDGQMSSGFIAEILKTATARLDPLSYLPSSSNSDVESASKSEPGRFALIGGPGQGKTTVGQYICQLFRTAILREKPEWKLDSEVHKILDVITTQCVQDGFELPTARRFPVRIILSKFAKAIASKEDNHINSLLSYIVDRIRRKADQEISLDDFRQWLRAYPWIIILDGLDEVPASSNRDEVLAALRSFRIEARSCNADILIIATTRPQGYSQEFAPGRFQHKYLAPLSPARAMHYGQRLIEVRYAGDQDRKEKILSRLERASQQSATARLMRSPLQVTIMATLVDRMGQPPQERWNLFREYYNVIYQREVERDIPAAAILRDYKLDVDTIHKQVGLLLQVESERTGKTDARLSYDDFATVVKARLANVGHQGEEHKQLARDIIAAATDRLVFLVGLEADEVGFEIRSLQEYMAAEGLMAGSDIHVRNRLREIATNANWRNVFLFAAGRCAAEREDLLDTIYTICFNLNDDPEDAIAQTTLAGSQLALDILEDTPTRQQPGNARSLARIAIRLLDLPPSDYHVRLGDLYHPVLEHIYRDELESRLNHINFNQRLGALACLIRLIEADVSWANKFKEEQWPSSPREQLTLLEVNNIAEGHVWMQSMIVDVIPHLSPRNLYEVFEPGYLEIQYDNGSNPVWAQAAGTILYGDPIHPGTIEVPLLSLETTSQTMHLFVRSITDKSGWLVPLKEMSDPSVAWIPLIAAARLVEAPSKETLAHELRNIANENDFDVLRESIYMLPWPISACLAASQDKDALLHFASQAEAGELGDIEDWYKAEERWQRNGITSEDIEYASDDRWPFDKHITSHGFPFAIGSWSLSSSSGERSLLNSILTLHSRLGVSHMRSEISRWLLVILGREGRIHTNHNISIAWSDQTLQRFQTITEDTVRSGYKFDLDSLNVVRWGDELNDQWIDFFDQLGKQPNIYKSKIIRKNQREEKLIGLLSKAFNDSPNRIGIFRTLSYFASKGFSLPIEFNFTSPSKFVDEMSLEAATIIKLAQRNWDELEVKPLAQHVADLTSRLDRFASTLQYLIKRLSHGSDIDRLLLELYPLISASQWELAARIISNLNDSLKRRTSELRNPKIWSDLNLPTGLEPLLRE